MKNPRILVVDDDPHICRLLTLRLQSRKCDVIAVPGGREALSVLEKFQPHLLITDLKMADMDGMALFVQIQAVLPTLPVIILTAHGTIPHAVEAAQRGVFAYLTKPYDARALCAMVDKALKYQASLKLDSTWTSVNKLQESVITQNGRMREMLDTALHFAQSDVSILIQSESGTGKEVLARAIHEASPRQMHPFVAVNCGAMPEGLLEAELFGYRKGAFTGADQASPGLFKSAHKGTLFLDEIGNMSLPFQAKLLRVLQDGHVRCLGEAKTTTVDVRIVAATHDNLERMIVEQRFREDLYYRLNVVTLELPPLRNRLDDVPLLANHFLAAIKRRSPQCAAQTLSPQAMEVLATAPWPGNVRQLLNVIEYVAALSVSPVISDTLVFKALRSRPDRLSPLAKAQSDFEHDYLVRVLRITSGNVSKAARLADRNRTDFYKLLHRHHLQPQTFREG